MGKNKIDLVNLLAKYQKGSNNFTQPNFGESQRQMQIQESFYGKRTFHPQNISGNKYPQNVSSNNYRVSNEPLQENDYRGQTQTTVFVGNFKMSKQQCESFLVQIQNQLNKQKKQINYQTENAYKEITQRFTRNHDKIRKQILELLDHAFRQNQKMMKQQLFKQSRNEPQQFNGVKYQIQSIQEQIAGFLRQLRGSQYRKAISEVVLKDFSQEIRVLKRSIEGARTLYLQNLGQIQPDITRIECIKNDLKSLFYFKKRTAKIIEKSIFSVLGQNNQMSPTKYNQSKFQNGLAHQASRTRKSFFNFGN